MAMWKSISSSVRIRPGPRDLGLFYFKIQALLDAGMTPATIYVNLHKLYKRNSLSLANVTRSLQHSLKHGGSIWNALSAHPNIFPNYHKQLIKVGESSGYLTTILQELHAICERDHFLLSRLVSATVLPIIYLHVGFLLHAIVAMIVRDSSLLTALLPASIFYAISATLAIILKYEPLGNIRSKIRRCYRIFESSEEFHARNLCRFLIIIRAGFSAGMGIETQRKMAIEATDYVGSYYDNFNAVMQQTGQFSVALKNCFNIKNIYIDMISTGEMTGHVASTLLQVYAMVANDYFEIVRKKVIKFSFAIFITAVFLAFYLIG